MANKLKNMLLKSVDLVPRGANPDADIKLFKSIDGGPEDNAQAIMKSEEEIEDMIEKSGDLMDHYSEILKASFESILNDPSLAADEAREMMVKSLNEFGETVVDDIVKGFSYGTVTNEGREGEVMKYDEILKSENLTEAEQQQIAALFAKATGEEVPDFVIEEEDDDEPEKTEKGMDNMKKSYEAIIKAQEERFAALEKRLEMQDIEAVAKKYEAIEKNTDELAATLYDMKKAGEDVYKRYIGVLDKNLELHNKSGIFGEIGKSYGMPVVGNIAKSDVEAKIEAFADGIQKADPLMNRVQAIAKAWEDHPELAIEYEESRR